MKKIIIPILTLLSLNVIAQQQPGVIKLTAEKLHARVREWPYPINGITVPTNAPALLWPGTNGKNMVTPMESGSEVPEDPNIGNVHYKVVLASDKDFKSDLTESEEQRWAVYPLHKALKPGKWYWKYGYALKGAKQWSWSPTYNFVVDGKYANEKVAPPIIEVLKRNQGAHPLLWGMNRIGDDFYRNNLENPEAKKFIAFAEKLIKEPLPTEKPQRIIDTTGKNDREKKIIIERMYHGFGDAVGTPVRNLCIAYQLTKDKRFILDAKRRALNIAKMDPNGLATGDDFTSGAVLEALGWFYDAGYAVLDPQEKELFKNIITIRAKRVYDHLPNRFELHVSDNHVWQITLRNLAIATVAVVNEVPEAKEWLTYMYEVWSARFPVLGTTDGGWHEGNGYFRVNFKSIIYLSQMFGDFSGVDYFKLPWMQNLPYYLLYTHPNGAASTAIGDMWENIPDVVKGEAWFADALTFRMNNPYLNWYVNAIKTSHPDYFRGTDDYLLFRLLNYKPDRKLPVLSPEKLPKSRDFADVGVVAMHEDLANADKTLSSYLFSSPFGSSGHGHASQNAFTINYKGKVLFGGSGYYSNFSDKHNLLYYRSSKAYNTILADSLNQKIGEEGYGWIPRAITGQHIQYALGDASKAYGEIKSEFWLDRFKQINLVPNKANGYGESGVTLYRRHILQLEGGYILLYDELEANKPVKWTTQFHAPYYTIEAQPTNNTNEQHFALKTDLGNVNAAVFANSALNLNVHNKFYETAVNWNKVTNDEGKIKDFVDQWHAGITSLPAQKFRFFTIIQVKDGKTEMIKTLPATNGLAHLQVGDWNIKVQLDGNKKAALQVFGKQANAMFNYGDLPISFNGQAYKPQLTGSSTLLEMKGIKLDKQEVVDKLPDVALYDKE
ncbi:DUF4962 domain-containing protein [Pedobacter roseus]|uniref:DUF4962 domain-containing protein n=1 Tax=Pedobacter roseus TaxID=336820 RepID=A0A7G9QAK4_9SPHI|nr:DUF4962 domain-containing protein [Pedobacter roseus]QNN40379.1 DUF4962 domain-containing protein [Pedobacter roseus]